MSITVNIPTPLRPYVEGENEVVIMNAGTVGDALHQLVSQYSDLGTHLYDQNNVLRKFVNVYLGDTDIRDIKGIDTPLEDEAVISIIPSIAGG